MMNEQSVAGGRYYSFLLPPGWVRLDLRGDDLGLQARRFADVVLANAPRDRAAQVRPALEGKIVELADQSKRQGVLDLMVPTVVIDGSGINASFAVLPFDTGEHDPVVALSAIASRDASAQLVEVADLVVMRTEETVSADSDALKGEAVDLLVRAGAEPGGEESVEFPEFFSRRVRYYVGHPDRGSDWVIVALSAVQVDADASRELTDKIVELFDEIMLTIRFGS